MSYAKVKIEIVKEAAEAMIQYGKSIVAEEKIRRDDWIIATVREWTSTGWRIFRPSPASARRQAVAQYDGVGHFDTPYIGWYKTWAAEESIERAEGFLRLLVVGNSYIYLSVEDANFLQVRKGK